MLVKMNKNFQYFQIMFDKYKLLFHWDMIEMMDNDPNIL